MTHRNTTRSPPNKLQMANLPNKIPAYPFVAVTHLNAKPKSKDNPTSLSSQSKWQRRVDLLISLSLSLSLWDLKWVFGFFNWVCLKIRHFRVTNSHTHGGTYFLCCALCLSLWDLVLCYVFVVICGLSHSSYHIKFGYTSFSSNVLDFIIIIDMLRCSYCMYSWFSSKLVDLPRVDGSVFWERGVFDLF